MIYVIVLTFACTGVKSVQVEQSYKLAETANIAYATFLNGIDEITLDDTECILSKIKGYKKERN